MAPVSGPDAKLAAPLRVAVDASSAAAGGGLTYLCEVLPRLATHESVELGPVLVRPQAVDKLAMPGVGIVAPPCKLPNAFLHATWSWRQSVRHFRPDAILIPTETSMAVYSSYQRVRLVRNAALDRTVTRQYRGRARAVWEAKRILSTAILRLDRGAMLVPCSRYVADCSHVPIDSGRLRIVPHGSDGDFGPPVPADHDGPIQLVCVSSAYRYKNFDWLVRALHRTDLDWHLTLIGGHPEPDTEARLRAAIRATDPNSVTLTGEVPREDVLAQLPRFDVFVWPSGVESFGHPPLEALACGLPVVALDRPCHRENLGASVAYFRRDAGSLEAAIRIARRHPPISPPPAISWSESVERLVKALHESAGRSFGSS